MYTSYFEEILGNSFRKCSLQENFAWKKIEAYLEEKSDNDVVISYERLELEPDTSYEYVLKFHYKFGVNSFSGKFRIDPDGDFSLKLRGSFSSKLIKGNICNKDFYKEINFCIDTGIPF